MLQFIFFLLLFLSLISGLIQGWGDTVSAAMMSAAAEGVETALGLAGGFAFFCGLIEILKQAGAVRILSRASAPFLRFLFGGDVPEDALDYAVMNLTANMLGMGNAATPMGIEAAKRMAWNGYAGNGLCLFLVINTSSVQLLPTSVIALRAAAGSQNPGSIILPTLLATLLSTLTGIWACKLWERKA